MVARLENGGMHVYLRMKLALVSDEASAAFGTTSFLRVPHVIAEAVLRALPPVSQEQGVHVENHAAEPLVSRLVDRSICYVPDDY